MPADERYASADPKTVSVVPHYGCHNKPRPVYGQPVQAKEGTYPYRFSTDCRYDKADQDKRCAGCVHAKTFEDWHKQ